MTEDVQQTEDSTTSFEVDKVTAHTYNERGEQRTAGVGSDPGDSADEVEPRRLMGDPSLDDLRWLYRTSLAKTLVDKPVEDAFKHGFDIRHEGSRDIEALLEDLDWQDHYTRVKKKARRDGFALTFFVLEDNSDGLDSDPMDDDVTVSSIKKLEAITLDDLARFSADFGAIPAGTEADPLEDLEYNDYEVRPTGLVMDTDPTSDTYKEPLGYLVGPPNWIDEANILDRLKFVHRNRVIHHVENDTVDGDLRDDALGRWEGDSTLVSVYHLLRGLKKGNWSLMQTIFRYASKLYHVELPEDADEEDFEQANAELQNLNAKSEVVTPANYEMEDFQTDGQLQPEEYFNVIFEQICAGTEMTKSVLFGTQAGTVSGSQTDIKNYFNKVERMRQTDFERDMRRTSSRAVALVDNRTRQDYDLGFEVDWAPMFRLSQLDDAERLSRVMQSLSAGINDFVLTPGEARRILQEEWADIDIDWEREFSEAETEWLKTLNVAQMGTEAALPQDGPADMGGNPRVGNNGGGSEELGGSEEPDANEDAIDRLADAVAERLEGEE